MLRLNDIMNEIAAASREQSAGIELVNSAVAQMDDVTQQNAALVEEAAAAAESLEEQARNLAEVVALFRLHPEASASAPAALPSPVRTASRPVRSRSRADDEWEEF